MTDIARVNEFLAVIESSPFRRRISHGVTLEFGRVVENLALFRLDSEEAKLTLGEFIERITPTFQRENTKWSQAMQRQFIQNLLAGCKTTLQFYAVDGDGQELDQCFVLDGLQRLTAIAAFQRCEFAVYDGFFYDEIRHRLVTGNVRLSADFYQFSDHKAACRHYIGMNEGITHSPEDMVPAYRFLESDETDS